MIFQRHAIKLLRPSLAFLKVIKNFNNSVYFAIYNSAVKMWLDNPLTGVGLNNFEIVCENMNEYKSNTKNYGNSTHPHNFYLQF